MMVELDAGWMGVCWLEWVRYWGWKRCGQWLDGCCSYGGVLDGGIVVGWMGVLWLEVLGLEVLGLEELGWVLIGCMVGVGC